MSLSNSVAEAPPGFGIPLPAPGDARAVEAYTVAAFHQMDRLLHGELRRENAQWNVFGGGRVRRLAERILTHARRRGLDRVRVLNMSGLNEGKPDPVVFDLVAAALGAARLSWAVVDHPLSDTFADATIRGWLEARGIERIAQDFRDPGFAVAGEAADIVLCTEIIEHLDYTTTTRLLRACRDALRPGGLLLVTTPNAVYVLHRIMFALGQWDFLHHMDAPEDVDRGLLGHITYYDARRLARLLGNLGFAPVGTETFNAGHGPGEFRNTLTRAAAIALRGVSRLLPHAGQVLLAAAERPL